MSAYAVEASQRSLAVRTDFDRRLFARYAPRVAADFVAGLGDALADLGTTLIDLGGVTVVQRQRIAPEHSLYKGLGEVANNLASESVQCAPRLADLATIPADHRRSLHRELRSTELRE